MSPVTTQGQGSGCDRRTTTGDVALADIAFSMGDSTRLGIAPARAIIEERSVPFETRVMPATSASDCFSIDLPNLAEPMTLV